MRAEIVQAWMSLAATAAAQHGIVNTGQVRRAGLDRGRLARAVASGHLHRVHRGVYALGHVPRTKEARWMAAVLACGERALLAHRCAAQHLRVRNGVGPRIDVLIPRESGRSRPGIAIHRSEIHPDDAIVHDGIPTTSPARLFADLAPTLGRDELHFMLGRADHLGLLDIPAARSACERRPNRVLRDLLEDLAITDSVLESEFLAFCDGHELPRPLTRRRVCGYRVDFLWREQRLVVETDGWGAHRSRHAFQADRSKSNRLLAAGYLVLRLTAADVRRRPLPTARLVRRALGRELHA